MKPLNDYIVVERIEDTTSDNLIVVSDDGKEKQPVGRVIAVGPGRFIDAQHKRCDPAVQKGDIILFYEPAAQKIVISGKEYYVMTETNIFLILENTDELS